MAVYQRLLAELDANGQKLSAQISEIDLTDPEDAQVLMPEQGGDILAHFGQDHFLERYQRYKAHIAEWRQQYPKLAAVDLRYDQQVVLADDSGRERGQAAAERSRQRLTAARAGQPSPANAGRGCGSRRHQARCWSPKSGSGSRRPTGRQVKRRRRLPAKSAARPQQAKDGSQGREGQGKSKKRADAKRAALNTSKQKTAPPITGALGRVGPVSAMSQRTGQPDCGAGHRQRLDPRAGGRGE